MPIVWLYTTENQKDNALEVIKKYTDEYQSKTPKSEGVLEYKVIIDEESEILKVISDMEDVSKSWIARERADGFMGLPPKETKILYKIVTSGTVVEEDTTSQSTTSYDWVKLYEFKLKNTTGLNFDSDSHYIRCTWKYRSDASGKDVCTRVYLNDSPIDEEECTDSDSLQDVDKNVNIGTSIPTDTYIQLYGKIKEPCTLYVTEFKIYYEIKESKQQNIYE